MNLICFINGTQLSSGVKVGEVKQDTKEAFRSFEALF